MGYMKDQDIALAERLISVMVDIMNKWEFGEITGFEMHQTLTAALARDPINNLIEGE